MSEVYKVYEVKCKIRRRIVANFPEDPEALKWVAKKEAREEKMSKEQEEALKQELLALHAETMEAMEEEAPTSQRNIFLRDEKGIYMTPRQIKGWLKEIFRMIGVRGYREMINHGVFVEPDKIYFMRNGSVIKKADGEVVNPITVITPKGQRSSVKVSEVINAPCEFSFRIKAFKKVADKLFTKENLEIIKQLGGDIGFLGDRSLQEGQADIEIEEVQ